MALTDNLVAYWKFDESSGNASDATGNGRTLVNSTSVTYSSGKINNGVDFGATNTTKFLSVANSLIGTYNADSYTVSVWLNILTLPSGNNQTICGIGGDAGRAQTNLMYIDIAGTKYFYWSIFNGSSGFSAQLAYTLTTGTWTHVVYKKSTTTVEVYVNGTSIGTASLSITDASPGRTAEFTLAQEAAGTANEYKGSMDEMGVWTRALSATEVSQLYNSGAGLPYPLSVTNGGTSTAWLQF